MADWAVRDDYTCPSCGQPELVATGDTAAARVSCSNAQCGRWSGGRLVERRADSRQPTA